MPDWKGFRGIAKPIEDVDIPRIGSAIGVGEDELHAFMDVEASGSGFDSTGRPKMLFEPHVFYRNLTGAKRDEAVRAGLAYAKWKAGSYPKDSYPRLTRAMEIDEAAALRACSWGLGQILGENHRMVGYATPQAMVRAFMDDEEHHLEAMVAFLVSAGIDDDLRAHRWANVARVYNGPSYATHNYHGRMAAAYAKWSNIKDTPWQQVAAPVPPPPPQPDDPGPVAPVEKPAGNAGKVVGGAAVPAAGAGAVTYAATGSGLLAFLAVLAVIGGLAAFMVWRRK